MKPKTMVLVVLLVLILIILFQNTQEITLRLFFWRATMPQILWISITLLIGFVAGFIAAKMSGPARRGQP